MKMTTLQSANSLNRSQLRLAFLLIPLACFALSPHAEAVCQNGCDTSNSNTFLGDDALISNTTGIQNTATGSQALLANTTGSANTAVGVQALLQNTTGSANTATGASALGLNTEGGGNTATGFEALLINTTGSFNTATGGATLRFNTTGSENTATGYTALFSNSTGSDNTATGFRALTENLPPRLMGSQIENCCFLCREYAYKGEKSERPGVSQDTGPEDSSALRGADSGTSQKLCE